MGKRKAEHGPNAFALEGPSNIEVNWSEIPVNPTPATTLSGPTVQVTQEGVPGRHVTTESATSANSPCHVDFAGVPAGQEPLVAVSVGEEEVSVSDLF